MMIFLESGLEFPDEWYLQPFFFLLPIVGLGAVADSVVRLAFLVFTQKQKLPEWQQMVASLYRNHVVVVGVGKVGYQIIKGLLELRETVVAVERRGRIAPAATTSSTWACRSSRATGGTQKTLEQAGVAEARAVILATSDDLANLDGGLTARDLNPTARIVLRLFDETLATKVAGAFAMPAISTAQVSAPAFIAAATGRKVYQEFQLAGQQVHLTDLTICPGGGLVGRTVGDIQADNAGQHRHAPGPVGASTSTRATTSSSAPTTSILVIAPMDRLLALEAHNRPAPGPTGDRKKPETTGLVPPIIARAAGVAGPTAGPAGHP